MVHGRRLFLAALIATVAAGSAPVLAQSTEGQADASTSASPEGILAVADYHGGFVQRVRLPLAAPAVVKRFRVAIPAFCGNVEIIEAGTVTEGVEDLAASDTRALNHFLVNGGAGTRVSEIFLTLNGPLDQSCQIPVIDAAAGDTPSACELSFRTTETLLASTWPDPVWRDAYTVNYFLDSINLSRPAQVAVAPTDATATYRHADHSRTSCVSYLVLSYDRAACGADFEGSPSQLQFMGGIVDNDDVTQKIYAVINTRGRSNLCIVPNVNGMVFNRR